MSFSMLQISIVTTTSGTQSIIDHGIAAAQVSDLCPKQNKNNNNDANDQRNVEW